jgi:hypothetical protein
MNETFGPFSEFVLVIFAQGHMLMLNFFPILSDVLEGIVCSAIYQRLEFYFYLSTTK